MSLGGLVLNGQDRHPPTTSSAGVRRRVGILGLVAGTCLAMAAFIPGGAQAAPSGSSTAQAAHVQIGASANALPTLAPLLAELTATVSTPLVDAPAATGSSTSDVGLGVDAGGLADVTTGDVAATSTRTASGTSAAASVAGAHIELLGTNVLSTGVITSSTTCTAGGTPTATAQALGLTVGSTTLDATVGASADVAVTAPGLLDASVEVTVGSPHAVTANTATATGLQVTLALHGSLAGLAAVDVPLGSVSLAASTCIAPAAGAITTAPTLTGLSPTSGPTRGGQTLYLTGTGFTADATVAVDGDAASDVTDVSSTALTAVTPAHAGGPVQVTVTTAAGTSGPQSYTYVPPTVTAIAPSEGPTAGGQQVTISGTGFAPDSAVTIGGTPATDVTVNPAGTAITATTPVGKAGAANVAVTAANTPTATLPAGYTYQAPKATTIAPNQGPTAGGQRVTISGSGFGPDSTVTIGGAPAADVTVNPAGTSIAATTPSGSAGPADVVIHDPSAPPVTLSGGYRYLAPTVTGMDPSQGPTAGGQRVTISGSGFGPGSTVTIGGAPATGVSTNDAGTAIAATTPAGTAGPADVVVSDAGQRATLANGYTYVPPAVTGIDPAQGPTSGGQAVTITGSGFGPDATVTIGGAPATGVSVNSAGTAIIAMTPAGPAGLADVVVGDPGSPAATLANGYTYVPPAVTGIDPARGPTSGGQAVTITGSGFGPGSAVTFGGAAASGVSVNGAGTSITATTPAGAAGPADVVVSSAGSPSATRSGGYTYIPPAVTKIAPNRGPTSGGQVVTLSGAGFGPDSTVTFGGSAAMHVTVNGPGTSITATTPAGAAGPADVVVSSAGSPSATLSGGYTYIPPAVTGIDPDHGPTSGGQVVAITGSGFGPDSTASLGGSPATVLSVNATGTVITATTPAGPAGAVDVVVRSPGSPAATLAAGYTYVPPSITGIEPNQGPTAGGQTVTVSGSGFGPGSTVTFSGKPATNTSVDGAGTAITVATPPGTAGPVDVVVTTAGSPTATLAHGYTYEPAPTVGGMTPSSGPPGGGELVTITGTGFVSGSTKVSFAKNAATDVTVVSPTTVTLRAPAGHGAEHVVVSTPGGSTTAPAMFTYVLGEATHKRASGALPFTGANSAELVGVGGWLVAAGFWALLFGNRRRRRA